MPPSKAIKTILIPKTDRFRVHLPRGSHFLGVHLLTDPEAQKTLTGPDRWDCPEWPVLHYMHDLHVKDDDMLYYSFHVVPVGAITEPVPLSLVGSFTAYGAFTFHVFEVPDDQRPPDPATTTTMPAQSLPQHPPGSGPAGGSPPQSSSPATAG